jgi:hypothetical protein
MAFPAAAQCTPSWSTAIGTPGLEDGYAGPMAVWDDGNGADLYVGGSFTMIAGQSMRAIGRWDPISQAWTPVAGGVFSQFSSSFVAAIAVHDSDLFVGGSFGTAGGVPGTANIARFDGTAWSSLGPALSSAVWSMTSWNGLLYVGGGFAMAGDTVVNGIAYYDGKGWNAVGSGFGGGFAPSVFAMRPFDDGSGEKLYVGGRYSSIGGINGLIARWNGSAWEGVGDGIFSGSTFADIEAMAVFDEDADGPLAPALYVGGSSLSIPGFPACSVAKWDGTAWAPVGQDLGGRTTSLAVFDDGDGLALYLGGTAQPGTNYFARLENNQWVPAFGGVGGAAIPPSNFPSVFGLLSWGDRLVVAGNFTQVGDGGSGGGSANGIAMLVGCAACPADFNEDGTVNSQDFFDFLTAFFAEDPSADFNMDQVINSQDFFDFLGAFFKGC